MDCGLIGAEPPKMKSWGGEGRAEGWCMLLDPLVRSWASHCILRRAIVRLRLSLCASGLFVLRGERRGGLSHALRPVGTLLGLSLRF